jgi:hypothetical protein
MKKCCNNCKLNTLNDCIIKSAIGWSDEEDYCSRWDEKEKKKDNEVMCCKCNRTIDKSKEYIYNYYYCGNCAEEMWKEIREKEYYKWNEKVDDKKQNKIEKLDMCPMLDSDDYKIIKKTNEIIEKVNPLLKDK